MDEQTEVFIDKKQLTIKGVHNILILYRCDLILIDSAITDEIYIFGGNSCVIRNCIAKKIIIYGNYNCILDNEADYLHAEGIGIIENRNTMKDGEFVIL